MALTCYYKPLNTLFAKKTNYDYDNQKTLISTAVPTGLQPIANFLTDLAQELVRHHVPISFYYAIGELLEQMEFTTRVKTIGISGHGDFVNYEFTISHLSCSKPTKPSEQPVLQEKPQTPVETAIEPTSLPSRSRRDSTDSGFEDFFDSVSEDEEPVLRTLFHIPEIKRSAPSYASKASKNKSHTTNSGHPKIRLSWKFEIVKLCPFPEDALLELGGIDDPKCLDHAGKYCLRPSGSVFQNWKFRRK